MDLLVVYNVNVEIDTGDKVETFVRLGAGFNNMSEALNEVVQQYFFLNGDGFAQNFVTGMAPAITLTGVRILGDAAQDYIFDPARKFGLLKNRNTKLKITRVGGDGEPVTITVPVTMANMSDQVGATTDGAAVSVELRFNGKPVVA